MHTPMLDKALVWFRRDLRNFDHAALYHALKQARQVYAVFVFDTEILAALPDRQDRRVEFIWHSVQELKSTLQQAGGDLIVLHGEASTLLPELAERLQVQAVFSNRDYEPAAIARDQRVASALDATGIAFHQFKDQVIFDRDEVLTQGNKPYGVFTPYKNAWLKKLNDFYLRPYPVERYVEHLHTPGFACPMPSLESLGFERTNLDQMRLPNGMSGGAMLFADFEQRMDRYQEARDYPAVKGPSYLSVHLRFGTVSIRGLARAAMQRGGRGAEPGRAAHALADPGAGAYEDVAVDHGSRADDRPDIDIGRRHDHRARRDAGAAPRRGAARHHAHAVLGQEAPRRESGPVEGAARPVVGGDSPRLEA